MKKKLTALLVGAALMLAAGSAWSTQLITNGDFSNGLAGWTVSQGNINIATSADPTTFMSGQFARFGYNPVAGSAILSQDFSVLGMTSLNISFNYFFHYIDTSANQSDTFIALYAQGYANPLAMVTLQELASPNTTTPAGASTAGLYNTIVDITGYTGTNGQVKFTLVEATGGTNGNGGGTDSYAGIDNVSVLGQAAPVPEPGTMVLLGAGMLGLAIFGKRRMGNKEA